MQAVNDFKREVEVLEQNIENINDSAEPSKVSRNSGIKIHNPTKVKVTEEEICLWKQCNKLLQSDKKLTKVYITSTIIHFAALVFVTISVSSCNYLSHALYITICIYVYFLYYSTYVYTCHTYYIDASTSTCLISCANT